MGATVAKKDTSKVPSWRDLQQTGDRRSSSKPARARRWLWWGRVVMSVITLAALVAGFLAIRHFGSPEGGVVPVEQNVRLELDFRTDGVITMPWVQARLEPFLQQDIRTVDVHQIKQQLESVGQIAHAAVAAKFPSQLVVQISERDPVLRVRVRGANGRPQQLLIARDGHVYEGVGYPAETIRRIPGAAGLKLRQDASGVLLPIEGVDEVAEFLEMARRQIPAIARHWRILNLEDWNPEFSYRPSLIKIRSAHIEELIFSTSQPDEQMRRLAAILEHTDRYQLGQPTFIDLSFVNESVIRYPD